MDCLELDNILERQPIKQDIIQHLNNLNTKNLDEKRGFYIYGNSGVGKTEFITNLLRSLNYDILYFDASDIRNKQTIEGITKNNIGDTNILSMFHKKAKKMAIVMDEIDGMTSSDKGGLATLIKLIRPKKTKKQQKEDFSVNPIFCISNYHVDKKIKELMKVTYNYELKPPSNKHVNIIIKTIMPKIEIELIDDILLYIDGDLRKLKSMFNIYKKNHNILNQELLTKIFQIKVNNDYTKDTIRTLMNNKICIKDHNMIMNETDRTIISLLYHENIIDGLKQNLDTEDFISIYYDILENYSFCDYMDRVTFQKQIWIYNEISSLIKIIDTNNKYHEFLDKDKTHQIKNYNPKDVRFTKILTKYSTEYNNLLFTQDLCQKLNLDKKDMLSFFLNLRNTMDEEELIQYLINYDIQKLDIQRLFRYIDKYTIEDNEQ
jgi:hypothetical protein